MITGQPVEKIVEVFGGRKTSGQELREWLYSLGVGVSPLKRLRPGTLPFKCNVVACKTTTRAGKTWKHWILIENGYTVYDPCINGTHSYEKYVRKGYMDDSRITSYFVIHATVDN